MKYIRSFFDNKKSIIKMDGCQHCPLMKFKLIDSVCLCRKFTDGNGLNVIEPWVLDHTDSGLILGIINTPNWCKLSNSLDELKKDRTTYKPFISSILIEENDMCNDDELPLIDIDKLSLKSPEKVYDYLMFLVDRSSITNIYPNRINYFGSVNDTDYYDDEYYGGTKYEPEYKSKHKICSSCGEEDETVKRNINYGMCESCWKLNSSDEERMKQAFINNFRMKRKNNFDYNKTFKVIKELKI